MCLGARLGEMKIAEMEHNLSSRDTGEGNPILNVLEFFILDDNVNTNHSKYPIFQMDHKHVIYG